MLRWPSLVLGALSLSLTSWPSLAHAQSEGAPLPDAPAPPPAETAPPATEPAPPGEPVAPTPPPTPAEPAPTPGTAPAVPSGAPSNAFPAPPAPSAAVAPPPKHEVAPAPKPSPGPTAAARPQRPTEGLFEERRPPEPVRHHEDEPEKEKTDHFKIGPVVGVGVPSVISFGGTIKVTRFLGAGINVGLIPKVKLSYYGDATLSYQHYDIYGRIYPLGGGFFLQGGAGYATVDGTIDASDDVTISGFKSTVNYNGKGSVRTLMLTALIGYFYTTSIGFSIGVDAGAQIPLAPSQIEFSRTYNGVVNGQAVTEAQINNIPQAYGYVTKSDQSIRDSLEKIGRTVLPTLNLRIGWIL